MGSKISYFRNPSCIVKILVLIKALQINVFAELFICNNFINKCNKRPLNPKVFCDCADIHEKEILLDYVVWKLKVQM